MLLEVSIGMSWYRISAHIGDNRISVIGIFFFQTNIRPDILEKINVDYLWSMKKALLTSNVIYRCYHYYRAFDNLTFCSFKWVSVNIGYWVFNRFMVFDFKYQISEKSCIGCPLVIVHFVHSSLYLVTFNYRITAFI